MVYIRFHSSLLDSRRALQRGGLQDVAKEMAQDLADLSNILLRKHLGREACRRGVPGKTVHLPLVSRGCERALGCMVYQRVGCKLAVND
jgi:hypothetical protein